MSLTLLFDLDNTLLSNGMDTFLPAYFQSLSTHVADLTNKDEFQGLILGSIQKAIGNEDPGRTLLETFECFFYAQLGLHRDELQPRFESFYKDVFPELKPLTEPLPEAVAVIEECFSRGYRVAIATNPLFPLAAVEHRLAWAGLPVTKYPFDLVAGLETFHFAKPNPAFFAEILARIGWPEGPVVVIGDDPINDIEPSKKLGFSSFHVLEGSFHNSNPRHGVGPLENFLPWLDNSNPDDHLPIVNSPEGLLSTLASTPGAIQSMLSSLQRTDYDTQPGSADWNLTQILCHLRDVEIEVNQPRIHEVLNTDNPFLKAENTDAWAEIRTYTDQNGLLAQEDFLQARIQTLQILRKLPIDHWQRTARHTLFGRTDLQELIRFVAEHDQIHLRQIFTVMGFINRLD